MEILLVEDERSLALLLGDALRDQGHRVTVLHEGAAALAWLGERRADLVLTDVRLPGADGLRVLERARALDPPAEVLVMTGYATVEQAVEAMRAGAAGYLQKPFPEDALLRQVQRIAELRSLQRELERLRAESSGVEDDLGLTGTSAGIRELRRRIRAAAPGEAPVLIQGESGAGKERVARALHRVSGRAAGPFVAVACGAVPEGLLEGELFGVCQGAYTGADRDREGLLDRAGNGTLFLDEVEELSLESQAALLRVLQEREFRPLGGGAARPLRARVLGATRIDLAEAVQKGEFREDLYFRLAVVPVQVPPLRERREDLPLLIASFLRELDPEGKHELPAATWKRLVQHDWPGNVRELENATRRALALCGGARLLKPEHFLPGGVLQSRRERPEDVPPLREWVRRAEREAIRRALAATGGRKAEAARLLGISRKALWQKSRELGVEGAGPPAGEGS